MRKLAAASTGFVYSTKTRNVQCALQAFGFQQQLNCQRCNVTARLYLPGSSRMKAGLWSNTATDLDATLKDGGIQKLDSVHGHRDHGTAIVFGWSRMKHILTTTQQLVAILRPLWKEELYIQIVDSVHWSSYSDSDACHPAQNLTLDKLNYGLGKPAPEWTNLNVSKWASFF